MRSILDYIKVFKNIETYKGPGPRNMAHGGRIGFVGGKRVYKNVPDQAHIKQHPVSKKYRVYRKVKGKEQAQGMISELDEAIKIRDQFVKDLPPETTAQTNIRTKTFTGKLEKRELNKAAKWFYKRGEVSSPYFKELPDLEKRKIRSNVAKGATPGTFSKNTIFTPLKTSQQNKILREFPEADFDLWKKGFDATTDPQRFAAVDDFIERGYKPAFHDVKVLPKKTQELIIEAFGKEAKAAGTPIEFGPGRKFGIASQTELYQRIVNFIRDGGKKYPYAFSFDKPANWIIAQMHRASKHNPKVYKMLYNDAGRIIGASENGVKYYHVNSLMSNTINKHPEAEKISKFVSVAKNAKANIPQSLLKIFPKGFDQKLLKGNRAYTDLLQWLDNSKGRRITANAINVHHGGAGGVHGNPALAKDLQLLTRQDNITAEVIKNQILDGDFSRVQELKDKGIRLNVGGKEYGAGFETAEQGLKRIETQAGTQLTERLKTDPKLKGFKKFLEQDVVKRFRAHNIPCIKGAGGQCNSIADYQKGYNQLVKEGAEGSAEAIQKLGRFTKGMRALTGAAKWTGYGLLAEAGFMVPFAIADYSTGESWKRILGNATDYGFGPILGQSEQEEFEAALPEGSLAVEGEKAIELGERLTGMGEQKVNPGYGRVGFEEKAPEQRQKVYEDIFDEYEFNLQPFLSDTPFAKDQWHQGMWTQAHEEAAAARAQIEKEKQQRIDERIERGIIADRNWQSQVSYAGGGMVGIRKPSALPPTGGPMSQGLRSLYINDKDY